jgi:SAM-dependent methyltransferase
MALIKPAARRFRSYARNWEFLGRSDPLFGVLSDPGKYGGKWDPDEFFQTGRDHVDSLLQSLSRRGITFSTGACLDFGCGVGRLTVPFADTFTRSVGVDVARSMIDYARRAHAGQARCEFILNEREDLRQLPDRTFDFVHSCLVLQHIPPDTTARYIAEFFRVCRPGGLVLFQVPAAMRPRRAPDPLPDASCLARITIDSCPAELGTSEAVTIGIRVVNESSGEWPHDIPDDRHISIANHWLRADGSTIARDDGRERLPRTIAPGASFGAGLRIRAPSEPGEYEVEVDLVQELTTWFAEKGSSTARKAIRVVRRDPVAASAPPKAVSNMDAAPWFLSVIDRIRRRLRRHNDPFAMNTVPRDTVEHIIRAGGGALLEAIDDNYAGPHYTSYTYICRKH